MLFMENETDDQLDEVRIFNLVLSEKGIQASLEFAIGHSSRRVDHRGTSEGQGLCDRLHRQEAGLSLNADVPLRREWDPPGEWAGIITRDEYHEAFSYHGSQGALAAVRWNRWKMHLNPTLTLYDLEADPGERTPIRNGKVIRKLRGMAILFQEEMRTGARPAGNVSKSR